MLKWAQSLSTKVASSLSDTFAPLFRSNLEQLQDAWRKVEADCQVMLAADMADQHDPKLLLESTHIIAHLNQMVEALVKEEEEQTSRAAAAANDDSDFSSSASSNAAAFDSVSGKGDKSTTGPCFEYFLNEKILDRLCALGLPDVSLSNRFKDSAAPRGMRIKASAV